MPQIPAPPPLQRQPSKRGARECPRCQRLLHGSWPHACSLPQAVGPEIPRSLECACGFFVAELADGSRYLQPSGARHRDHPAMPEFLDEEAELRIHRWYETEGGRAGAQPLERPPMTAYERPKRLAVNPPEPQAPQGPEAAAPAQLRATPRRKGRTL